MQKYLSYLVTILFYFLLSQIFSCTPQSQLVLQKQSKHTKIETRQNRSESNLEQKFISKVNELRAQGRMCGKQYFPPAKPLIANDRLTKAALGHSKDMSQYKFLDHISSNGDTLVERLQKTKYVWRVIAENVAHNQRSIEQVLQDWLSSSGHCSNMMSADYVHTGVAQIDWYWTQVYAAP